ncbi:MAG TPA: DHA2 family efflux MFS transporter permease subunit [Bryobacteraceae bacterium]|nr:DHA2 family efflux MFS transporter permease subunit [Bryobacteraceae bacterium]
MSEIQTTEWKPKVNPWIIAVTVSLAAFMEVLDSSIANVALPHIAGGLGVSNDESTWVLTSYLVSNAIVLPLSGYMVSVFGRKRFFLACIALFTLSSLLCGVATSLGLLLLFRVMQGAFGGGLQPMAQSILADSFPAAKRGVAFSVYGITAVCAPAIGPTLGGWLTDNYSWRWVFYINIPVGILAIFLVQQLIEDPPYLSRLRKAVGKFDYVGFSLLTIGVAALQIALDKGQEDDWFGSTFITTLIVTAAIGLIALVIWEWFQKTPIVDVRLFKSFNFAATNVMFFVVGMILFSSTVLMPQFLQTLMGYTAQIAGLVLSAGAVVLLATMPVVGQLAARVQARYLLAVGWAGLLLGMYVSSNWVNLYVSFGSATWVRILQYLPLGLIFVPLNVAGYTGLAPEKTNGAAGLMNFTRNIGQSVGTSAVTTLIARRSQFHQSILAEHSGSGAFDAAIQSLTSQLTQAGMTVHDAGQQAVGRLYGALQAQAATLAYVDVFWLLAGFSALMFLCSFLLKANKPGGGANVSLH